MTTNSAMGGNMAIESAACLANLLERTGKIVPGEGMQFERLPEVLNNYQQIRFKRASAAGKNAGELTRIQFLPSLWSRFAVKYMLPWTTSASMLRILLSSLDGGIKIDYLNVPENALKPLRPTSPLPAEPPSSATSIILTRPQMLVALPLGIVIWKLFQSYG